MALVWYAAYGSNLSRARFDIYLKGGRPDGASHTYPGGRDSTPPTADEAGEIDAELAFGGTSVTWGGGVAFVTPGAGTTLARFYLVTKEQFEDVAAQENWLDPGTQLTGSEMYGLVLDLGSRSGHPVLTVTQSATTQPAAPSLRYLRHIATGLRESHDLSAAEIADYLGSTPGIEGSVAREVLISELS